MENRISCLLAGASLAVVAVAGCSDMAPTGPDYRTPVEGASASAAAPPNIAGDWVWQHRTVFIIPTPVAFGVTPEEAHPFLAGPVTKIECTVSGTMQLVQAGSQFGGTSTQTSDCALKTGPNFAMPFVFQSPFEVSNGEITGRSFRFNVGPGCLNRGNLRVVGGVVESWRGSGHCEIPIPVHPRVSKTIRWEAERA